MIPGLIPVPLVDSPSSLSLCLLSRSPSFFRFLAPSAVSKNCFSILDRCLSGRARIRSISSFFSRARSLERLFLRCRRASNCSNRCCSSSVRSTSSRCWMSTILTRILVALALDCAFLRDLRSRTSCVDGTLGLMYVLRRVAMAFCPPIWCRPPPPPPPPVPLLASSSTSPPPLPVLLWWSSSSSSSSFPPCPGGAPGPIIAGGLWSSCDDEAAAGGGGMEGAPWCCCGGYPGGGGG